MPNTPDYPAQASRRSRAAWLVYIVISLALGCAAPVRSQEVPAVEELPASKPGDPYYTLRSYFFRTTPKMVARTNGSTGKVLYVDPSLDIPVGSTLVLGEPEDNWCGGGSPVLIGKKWLVINAPVEPMKSGGYQCMLDNLDHVDGAELVAYDGADMPENWRKVRDIIRQEMAVAPGPALPAKARPGCVMPAADVPGGLPRLFDAVFPEGDEVVPQKWNVAFSALVSAGWSRNEAGRAVYTQTIIQITSTGSVLTTYSRFRFADAPADSWNYGEITQKEAVEPFVFMDSLTMIVDRQDETVYFDTWDIDPATHQLRSIKTVSYNIHTAEKKEEHVKKF